MRRNVLHVFTPVLAACLLATIPAAPSLASIGEVASSPITGPVGAPPNSAQTVAVDTSDDSAPTPPPAQTQMTITPVTGPGGTRVTIMGTGLSPDANITVTFDNATTNAAPASTSPTGSFSTSFDVPASPGGPHVVTVSDGTNAESNIFTVMTTALLKPTSGYVGTKVDVGGTGFLAGRKVNILFDNIPVQTVISGPDGSLSISFEVPAEVAGTYSVKVTDGTNSKDLSFAVTTSASISPLTSSSSPGYVGQGVTVSGVGFLSGKTVTVSYDGNQVATGPVGSDSQFSLKFMIPPSKGGPHTITVSDGLNSLPVAFFMDTTPPPPPALTSPDATVVVPAGATFNWTAVNDLSGVTYTLQIADNPQFSHVVFEKSGIDKTEYQLTKDQQLKPSEKNKPYYWQVKAVDGASNESRWSDARSFTVASPFPRWALYTLIGLSAAIVILLVLWVLRRSANQPTSTEPGKQGQAQQT